MGALVAVITALDVWWRTLDARSPHWDMAKHLGDSLVYRDAFSLTDPLPFLWGYLYYPPLVSWVTDAFYAVTGSEEMWVAVLSNVVWIAVLVFATYEIGKTLWNERVGLLSVVFVVTTPMLVTAFKEYLVDAPLTAVVALALYLLIRANGFSSRKYSMLFGVACGFGLLVKWTFPLGLAFPVVQAMAVALHESRQRRTFAPLLNLAGAGALTFAVAGTWYVHNFISLADNLDAYTGPRPGAPGRGSLGSVLWYFWNLLDRQLFLVPFLFLVAGIVLCFRRRELAARNLYPILTIVGTYIAFTLLGNKDARYTLPMLPAVAVVATSWLEYVSARARVALSCIIVVYGAAAFLAISFGTSLLPKDLSLRLGPGPLLGNIPSLQLGSKATTLFSQVPYIIGPPSSENWHQEDAFRAMERVAPAQRSFAYRGSDSIWFNLFGIRYYALRFDAEWVGIRRAHFLLVRGAAAPDSVRLTRLERWRLPDGGILTLYAKD